MDPAESLDGLQCVKFTSLLPLLWSYSSQGSIQILTAFPEKTDKTESIHDC